MVVGEAGYPQQAYVYVESGSTWSLTDTLVGANTLFGQHVAVYDDTIVVANTGLTISSSKGHAYVYKLISGAYCHHCCC